MFLISSIFLCKILSGSNERFERFIDLFFKISLNISLFALILGAILSILLSQLKLGSVLAILLSYLLLDISILSFESLLFKLKFMAFFTNFLNMGFLSFITLFFDLIELLLFLSSSSLLLKSNLVVWLLSLLVEEKFLVVIKYFFLTIFSFFIPVKSSSFKISPYFLSSNKRPSASGNKFSLVISFNVSAFNMLPMFKKASYISR